MGGGIPTPGSSEVLLLSVEWHHGIRDGGPYLGKSTARSNRGKSGESWLRSSLPPCLGGIDHATFSRLPRVGECGMVESQSSVVAFGAFLTSDPVQSIKHIQSPSNMKQGIEQDVRVLILLVHRPPQKYIRIKQCWDLGCDSY